VTRSTVNIQSLHAAAVVVQWPPKSGKPVDIANAMASREAFHRLAMPQAIVALLDEIERLKLDLTTRDQQIQSKKAASR
jgi:hypothetical protein